MSREHGYITIDDDGNVTAYRSVDPITPVALTGGGGGGPTPLGLYAGNAVSVTVDEGNHELTWDSLGSGDAVLDLSNPLRPTVLTEGIYAVSAVVQFLPPGLDAGKGFIAVLHLDFENQDLVNEATTTGASAVNSAILVSLSSTGYVPAGGVIAVTVSLPDNGSALDFNLREASVQRIRSAA